MDDRDNDETLDAINVVVADNNRLHFRFVPFNRYRVKLDTYFLRIIELMNKVRIYLLKLQHIVKSRGRNIAKFILEVNRNAGKRNDHD